MTRVAFIVCLLSLPCLAADSFQPGLDGKKLISYGADWPNTAYVRAHVREMETHPFDGIVIGVSESREPQLNGATLGTKAWGREKFDPAKFEHAIEDLKATKFEKFTHNFIQVEAMPGDVDWFDEGQWDAVVHNFRTLARIARQGGCVGLEFDPEEYGDEHVFTPAAWDQAKRHGRGEVEYVQQAIARGQQLMRAINSEFPGIKILCLFGPSLTANMTRAGGHEYRLLAPFLEGMCRAADAASEIIDGYELSYGYRTPMAFERGRQVMRQSRESFIDKASFDRVMRIGFGLWTDNNSGQRGWYPDEPQNNHFQPATWQNAVHSALSQSDQYVWVWREQIREWEGKNVAPAYEEAQRAARKGLAPVAVERLAVPQATRKLVAAQGGRDWGSTLGHWLETRSVLLDLTTPGWEFRPDGREKWSPIEIGIFWEEDGWDFDGIGWYRRRFELARPPEGHVELVFGACDESAEVMFNGEKVGGHDEGEAGWDRPFVVDLTGKLRAGTNELLVRVTDLTGPGGIWKPAAIFVDAPQTTKGKKIIEYGWDCPDTAFVRAHAAEMERRPFNGVVIRAAFPTTQPGKRAPSLGRTAFQHRKFQPADYQHCIDDLAATKWEKFTDNFIQILSQPGDVDWFDDAGWDAIAHNAAVLARIVKAGNCVGLMLDPEEYGPHKLWTYAALPKTERAGRSLDEFRAQVRRRGEQFIRAVNGELPNAKILCLFGPSLTFGRDRAGKPECSLLAAFVEGIARGADAGTRIIDGCEQSYMYRTRTSFRAGRRDVLLARETFTDRTLFDRFVRVGFGLWLDNGGKNRPWDLVQFQNNYFQSDTWQNAIHFGLSSSDEYVWVYSQQPNWWTGEKLVRQYEQAQRDGRERFTERLLGGAASVVPPKFVPHAPPVTPPADAGPVVVDLSASRWSFMPDPADVGMDQRWYSPTVDATRWPTLAVGKFWEEQGFDYDGYAWYRINFRLPDRPKKVMLHIGAADESAVIWLNGRPVGEHDIGENGWDRPLAFEITHGLAPGEDQNVLAIRVLDRAGAGGLWRAVTLNAGH
jgi:hypothetical protein